MASCFLHALLVTCRAVWAQQQQVWLAGFEPLNCRSRRNTETRCSRATRPYLISLSLSLNFHVSVFTLAVWILRTFHILYSYGFLLWHVLNDNRGKRWLYTWWYFACEVLFFSASLSGFPPGGTSLRLTHSTKPESQVGEWLQEPALLSAGAHLTILPLLPAPRRMNTSERDLPHKTHFDLARCIFLN